MSVRSAAKVKEKFETKAKRFTCVTCAKEGCVSRKGKLTPTFSRHADLRRHVAKMHKEPTVYTCLNCKGVQRNRPDKLREHFRKKHAEISLQFGIPPEMVSVKALSI